MLLELQCQGTAYLVIQSILLQEWNQLVQVNLFSYMFHVELKYCSLLTDLTKDSGPSLREFSKTTSLTSSYLSFFGDHTLQIQNFMWNFYATLKHIFAQMHTAHSYWLLLSRLLLSFEVVPPYTFLLGCLIQGRGCLLIFQVFSQPPRLS